MKPTISLDIFSQVELRVGKVLTACIPEWSQKLIELKVDFGEEVGQKTILTGVKQWYSPEALLGNSYVFVVNLAERKMGEGVSQGMILMAEREDKPIPITVTEEVPPGASIR